MRDTRKMLEDMAAGFMPARILISAVELGVCNAIGGAALSTDEIARAARTDPEALRRLLNALCALKVLRRRKGKYVNSAAAQAHLVEGAPGYLGDIMRHRAGLWSAWSHLTDIVRTGKVPSRRHTKEREKAFIKGMANIGVHHAAAVAAALKPELAGAARVLDVGGGPAVYACELARAAPGARVTVLDLPGPLAYARETIKAQGLTGRVKAMAADALAVPSYGRGYDVVFMSNFIHSFPRAQARSVVGKAARALRPGGALAVKDFYISDDGTRPAFAALFAINMLVADAGDCFTRAEVEEWMRAAGVAPTRTVEAAAHSAIIIGVRRNDGGGHG